MEKNICINGFFETFSEFLTYLDEVDQNCVKTLRSAKDRVKNVGKVTNSAMNVDTIPK